MVQVKGEDLSAWNALRLTPGLGPKRLTRIASALWERGIPATSLLGSDAAGLEALGLGPELAHRAAASLAAPAPLAATPSWVHVVSPDDDLYPRSRVSEQLPLPVLMWIAGSEALLGSRGLAIAGSRAASPEAIEITQDIAGYLAKEGWNVVSGLAVGVDQAAHNGALEAEGTTTAVLAEGILGLEASLDVTDLGDRVLLVSGFEPDAPWTPARAMERNTYIAALADAVVIVSAGLRGGSWEQGRLCLKASKRLLVVDLPAEIAPGNDRLIELGAEPLPRHHPELILESLMSQVEPEPPQIGLFGLG